MLSTRDMRPSGDLGLRVIRGEREVPFVPPGKPHLTPAEVANYGCPQKGLPDEVNDFRRRNQPHLRRGLWTALLAHRLRIPTIVGRLWGSVLRADGSVVDLGLLSQRVVTTTGVNFLVDAWQNLTPEIETLRHHGIGTGTNAEAMGDTALQTELTTQYLVNSTRIVGTLGEGAAANVFRSTATVTVDVNAQAITEWGLFSQTGVPGGTMWDRAVFGVNTLDSGDGIAFTYDCTLAANG